MSWWGGSKKEDAPAKEADFTSHDDAGFRSGSNLMTSAPSSSSSSGGGGSAASAGLQQLQQIELAIQQQMAIQQVINDLSDRSYTHCITSKPSETLSGSQAACIQSTVNKWMDTNEFIMGRLQKKSAAQHQQHGGGFA